MNSLTFVKGAGGLGRPLANNDHISGILFYSNATLPSGFSSNDRIKIVYSLEQAVALGITNTSLGATQATATFLVTNAGADGNTITFTVSDIDGTKTLCSYAQNATDAGGTTACATKIAAQINLGTPTHGYTATSNTATVTITAPANQGLYLNTGSPYTFTTNGTVAGTLTQNVVPGVASDIDILHYHVSEFFRMQPKGKLYISIQATSDIPTFAQVTTLRDFANGEIRQIGVYQKSTAFAGSQVTALQTVATAAATAKKPLSIIYCADIEGTADLSTLANMRLLNAPNVSVVIGQDGGGRGRKLFLATDKTIGILGLTLGAVAFAAVHENIAWYSKFDANNGTECDTLAFGNGNLFTALSDSLKANLDAFGYIFLVKEIGLSGSYFNDSHTSVPLTSDYAYIESNRTIDKAIRNLRTTITPALGSPLYVNEDGQLSDDVIGYFETLGQRALDGMKNSGELSDFAVVIDPSQDVLSTSTLTIAVQLLPVGSARSIVVNIGYVLQLTTS